MTVEEVVKTLHTNAGNSRAVAAGILEEVAEHVAKGELDQIRGSMKFACITRAEVSLQFTQLTVRSSLRPRARSLRTSFLTTLARLDEHDSGLSHC